MLPVERIRCLLVLVVLALAGAGGCSAPKMFSLDNTWPFGDDEPNIEIPNRVAGMWTDTVLHKSGQAPQRGFGGRLLFYGKDAEKPVLVDGELVVYAFDETGREPTDNKPTRRYVFPADQMVLHQSESPVGPSYSFWLPWDEAGGMQTEVSLICRFQPKGGAVVVSEQTKHRLPGKLPAPGAVATGTPPKLPEGVPSRPAFPQLSSQMSKSPAASGAQQASYEVAATPAEPNALPGAVTANATPMPQMTTTTIALPKDFQIPQGAAQVTNPKQPAVAPQVRQIVPPGQYPASQFAPTTQPSAAAPNQPNVPGQGASVPPNATRSITAYQPQARTAGPPVYNPVYAPPPTGQASVPPSQMSGQLAMHVPQGPQHTAQSMHQLATHAQQPPQFAGGGTTVVSPQTAAQMMQVPTSGTATVTYR